MQVNLGISLGREKKYGNTILFVNDQEIEEESQSINLIKYVKNIEFKYSLIKLRLRTLQEKNQLD